MRAYPADHHGDILNQCRCFSASPPWNVHGFSHGFPGCTCQGISVNAGFDLGFRDLCNLYLGEGREALGSFAALVIPGEIKVSTSSHQVNNRNKLY